jgi:hypothetical protein
LRAAQPAKLNDLEMISDEDNRVQFVDAAQFD